VDTLISNAGVLHFGKFLNTTDTYIDFITALHYTTPMKLCRLFGQDMAAKGKGKILIMCSMTAWTPFPTMSLYGSTKAALKSFAQSFWYEMREKGVSVTTVYPGAVDTPLYNLPESKRRLFRALGVMSSAESVARKGLKAMNRRRRRLIPGLFTKFVVAICAVLPAVVLLPVMKIPAIRRILDRL
jgi:short-subunit dehydrogenase